MWNKSSFCSLSTQRESLFDAKPMLLIDDGKSKPVELHLLLKQGMGSDDQHGPSFADIGERILALLLLLATG